MGRVKEFAVVGRQTGYLGSGDFMGFLQRALTGGGDLDNPLTRFANVGEGMTFLLILVGGLLLNLTPCILPMIPINLAIIGAGKKAQSRGEGFRNGGIYGLGMALAYGALGLVVVLTGAKFGALNASMWFNAVVALGFVVLALGRFDVVNIDIGKVGAGMGMETTHFTRSTVKRGVWMHRGVVFILGIMAALLAGRVWRRW